MKGTHTQQRRRGEQKQKQQQRLRSTGPRAECGEKHQLMFFINNFPAQYRGPSALGFLEREASLCLSWSDSKGTRVSPQGPLGSPTQLVLFQTQNFSLVSQEPEGPGPEVSSSECLPSFHEAVCRWGSLFETHLGQRGGAGEEQTDQGPEKSSTLKIAFPLRVGRSPESQELPAGVTFPTGQGFLTGKGAQGQGAEGERGCSAPGREQGRTRDLSDSSGFPGGSVVKNPLASAGDVGSIPELGRFPGGGDGNPLQHSCLGNPMERGAWQGCSSWDRRRVRHNLETQQQQKQQLCQDEAHLDATGGSLPVEELNVDRQGFRAIMCTV